ncbi:MAG: hypothetical protein JO128_18880, partial [Alphaproteobacteria bacterium]|nr:hypothetical protein [Alphaproteobacteria bacterium]
MFLPLAFACGCATPPAPRADVSLAEIHAVLEPMRAAAPNDRRDATPALMNVKHGLRDWIEARLKTLPADGDEHVFAAQLNEDLKQADLLCAAVSAPMINRCAARDPYQWDMIGFVEPVQVELRDGFLFVRTGVGIFCGGDDSAYGYELHGDQWQRIWAYEQPIETGVDYRPQDITGFRMSWPDQHTHQRLLLLLGKESWCTSNWYRVYVRLWRLHPGGTDAELLLDRAENAYFAEEPPIEGAMSDHDATIEFRAGSLDPEFHSYEAVRRYEIVGDHVTRVPPVALGPRGFVEEWLRGDWAEVSTWTAPESRTGLQSAHARLHPAYARMGEYIGDHTQQCRKSPDLWQVGIAFDALDPAKRTAHFLVRWQPPYRFQMVAVSPAPRIDCDLPDKAADD